MPLLDVKNLSLAMRSYDGEAQILRGVDLAIERGEIWGMVGETGGVPALPTNSSDAT